MRIESSTVISHPLDAVVAWHQRPGALQRLCPPGLGSIDDPREGGIQEGRRVVTRMGPPQLGSRVRPTWVLRHSGVRESAASFRFEDTQLTGPFRLWRHRHGLAAVDGGRATRLDETIDLELPASLGERTAAAQMRRMLAFRARQLQADLDLHARCADAPRLTVAIAGSSGALGVQLTALLETGGHTVRRMLRAPAGASPSGGAGGSARSGDITWDPAAGRLDPADLAGVDAVVNLAGSSIATRLTRRARREILASRTATSGLLARALADLATAGEATGPAGRPRALIQASGIGYYGARRPGERLTEDSAPGDGFLADVCRAWEGAMAPATAAGVRTCALRTGIVLSDGSGALLPQLPLFLAGLGGPLTRPDAMVSWITLDDAVRAYAHALAHEGLAGPVNLVAPGPVSARELADTLGRVLHRPARVPVPAWGPALLLGREGAREIIATDQDVSDDRLRSSGFAAAEPELEGALRHVLRR